MTEERERAEQALTKLNNYVVAHSNVLNIDASWMVKVIEEAREGIEAARLEERKRTPSFQSRVHDWMKRCFLRPDGLARDQRAFRFIEEALELVQASGTTREDVLRLVDYVYNRPVGIVGQEIGGVMVTLAGLATSCEVDLPEAAENELQRCEAKTDRIREKDLAKPQRSPLPGLALKGEG